MNIFYLDKCAKISAESLIDKHCNKMILESCQLLCTALNYHDKVAPYKPTHINHPCSKWTRLCLTNYNWLCTYTTFLLQEFTYRFNKEHKSSYVLDYCIKNKPNIEYGDFTEPPQCMPIEYQSDNTILSYRNYYNIAKRYTKAGKFMFIWTKRKPPEWAIDPLHKA